jgi:transposase
LVYIDETGIDNNETYDYAWGIKGQRIHEKKQAERNQRISIIAALNTNLLIAPFVFEGSCNRSVFETYLEKVLIPQLKHGQIVILDNASFHKGGRIKELIEKSGCLLYYLPPYSPDLNPIEHFWYPLKQVMRKSLKSFNFDLFHAAEHAFQKMSYAT